MYSVALLLAFLSAKNEIRQLKDLPPDDFDHLPERLLLSVRTKSINENFVNWKLRPLLVSANVLYDCYSEIVDSFIFIH